jgi:hypothetical protein
MLNIRININNNNTFKNCNAYISAQSCHIKSNACPIHVMSHEGQVEEKKMVQTKLFLIEIKTPGKVQISIYLKNTTFNFSCIKEEKEMC